MTSNQRFSALMCGLCAVVLACDGPAVEPVAPSPAEASVLLTTGWKASGHPVVQGTPVQNVQNQRYSFTAISTDASSAAKGQVEVHYVRFTGEEIMVHANVTCLSVMGEQAWVGAEVSRLVFNGAEMPDRVGIPMIFRVVDVGEGEDATDLASLVFFPPPGGDIAHCTTRPDFPILRESTGNIQVKPE
jgi:hypothetical protein